VEGSKSSIMEENNKLIFKGEEQCRSIFNNGGHIHGHAESSRNASMEHRMRPGRYDGRVWNFRPGKSRWFAINGGNSRGISDQDSHVLDVGPQHRMGPELSRCAYDRIVQRVWADHGSILK